MKKAVFLFFSLVSSPLLAADNTSTIKPVLFSAVKNNSAQHAEICHSLEKNCSEKSKLWREKGAGDVFYLTDDAPELIKIKKLNGKYIKAGQWDFSHYDNTDHGADGELTREDVYLFPALYPLSKTKQAVALVSKWSTGYSGGGREEEYADFIMLNEDGTSQAAFKNIPFSSHEMIRACFSEEDYARQSHCHDESGSILNLKFIDDGQAFYLWKFITKSSDWPSFTDKASITVEVTEKLMTPFQSEPQSE